MSRKVGFQHKTHREHQRETLNLRRCPDCQAKGWYYAFFGPGDWRSVDCPKCGGRGLVEVVHRIGNALVGGQSPYITLGFGTEGDQNLAEP